MAPKSAILFNTSKRKKVSKFEAGLEGVTFTSKGCRLLGGFYKAAGDELDPLGRVASRPAGHRKTPGHRLSPARPRLNCLYFHFRGCWGSEGVLARGFGRRHARRSGMGPQTAVG